ncbi:MAG: hypothetical protein A4E19_08125 [Nitrospira sp. SG-bin1]|nr:MAG: hypothetical protein A4E19_08125 [Nitrospira sp. SG-bin1]
MNRIKLLLPLLFVCLLLPACSSTLNAKRAPGTDLSRLKSLYVQRLPADGRGVEQLIARRLTQMGFRATYGDGEIPPIPVDGIVTYQDKWMWDITMYMLQLSVQVRDPKSRMVLMNGESMRTSLVRKDPEGMVEEVLTEMFKGDRP